MTSTYEFSTDLAEINGLIQENLDLGFNLVDMEYADGTWFATLRNTPDRTRSFSGDINDFNTKFNETKTWRFGNDLIGYDLIDAEYGDGIWYSTYGNVEGVSQYSYSDNYDDFAGAVQDYWSQGYDLVDVEYADGSWLATFGDLPGFSAYSSADNVDELTGAIQQRWDEGFGLVDVEYADGTWFGVFNERTSANAYSDSASFAEFESDIQELANEGYDLIDVAYGDGTWFGVYSETIADPTYTTPSLSDQSQLNQGFFNSVVSSF